MKDFSKKYPSSKSNDVLDEVLDEISKAYALSDTMDYVINEDNIEEFNRLYNKLRDGLKSNAGIRVLQEKFTYNKFSGVIRIEGKRINITNLDVIIELAKASGGIDIAPNTNGDITIEFTFNSLASIKK